MDTLPDFPAGAFIRLLLLLAAAAIGQAAHAGPAPWFPDAPRFHQYAWETPPCPGCTELSPAPAWTQMAQLAGLQAVRFLAAPNSEGGEAYAAAPDTVVLSPAALQLPACQLAFVVGHEIVHLAQRHFDEDAIALSVLSGKSARWTTRGEAAMSLIDGDFGLALRVSHLWQQQEHEADWLGALLAAQACGCSLEAGALAYLGQEDSGGGVAAAHATSARRAQQLLPFRASAQRLADRRVP